jgi:hypothetical protein
MDLSLCFAFLRQTCGFVVNSCLLIKSPGVAMAGKIFISYRRDDSRYQARMIYEAFVRGLPRENVFMDIDTIPLGVNFVKVLESWVEQCEVLLVLIGADWVNSTDPKTGKRRLDNPRDFVRVEIRGALTRDIPVVPVLLDDAEIPDETQLPEDIRGLLHRNAEFVEYRTFDADVQRLIKKLGVSGSAKQAAASAQLVATMREQVAEPNARESAEGSETQGDLADKPREKKTLGREWSKRWLTPMAIATVLLAAAVIVTLVSWSPGLLSGRKVEVTTKEVDSARQAAEAKLADADKARQAAEAKAADAQKALQAAQAQASDAEKARQAAEAKDADAEKARQAAQTQAADAEKARQAAEAKLADAEKARQAAEAKANEAEKARQAAAAKADDAEYARQSAETKAAQATAAQAAAADGRQTAGVNVPATAATSTAPAIAGLKGKWVIVPGSSEVKITDSPRGAYESTFPVLGPINIAPSNTQGSDVRVEGSGGVLCFYAVQTIPSQTTWELRQGNSQCPHSYVMHRTW